jgi:hypothetical protein
MELENVLADGNCMTRVIATAVSSDDVGLSREQVGDTTFAFITPLGANDHV